MKRSIVAVMVSLGLVGCPDHEPQTLMAQVVLLPEAGCAFQAQTGGSVKSLANGTVDLTVNTRGYIAGIQLFNGLPPSSEVTGLEPESGYLENNFIQVFGATISYSVNGLSVGLPQERFQYAATSVGPQQSSVGILNLLPPDVLEALRQDPLFTGSKEPRDPLLRECLTVTGDDGGTSVRPYGVAPIGGRRATIIARVTFEGQLQDGTQVLSNEFPFRIEVCVGCLLAGQSLRAEELYGFYLDGGALCADEVLCGIGADTCSEYASCLNQNLEIPESANAQLLGCAANPAFGLSQTAQLAADHPFCGFWDATRDDIGFKAFQLQCRYTFDKWNAFCSVGRDDPLWPLN